MPRLLLPLTLVAHVFLYLQYSILQVTCQEFSTLPSTCQAGFFLVSSLNLSLVYHTFGSLSSFFFKYRKVAVAVRRSLSFTLCMYYSTPTQSCKVANATILPKVNNYFFNNLRQRGSVVAQQLVSSVAQQRCSALVTQRSSALVQQSSMLSFSQSPVGLTLSKNFCGVI